MISNIPCDIQNYILSFVIGDDNIEPIPTSNNIINKNYTSIKYLTNDVLFLRLTSKEWNRLINNYIKHYYKNTINYYHNGINFASERGHVSALEWFHIKGYKFKHKLSTIIIASENGHTNVLEWFKNNDNNNNESDFKNYDITAAIESASENGHVNVLEWFKRNEYDFEYYGMITCLSLASKNGHINVLEWFINTDNKYIFKYNEIIVESAVENGRVNVLEWVKSNNYTFKYNKYNISLISVASQNGHVNVLEWWKNSGYEFNYDVLAISLASEKGLIHVLEWWKNSGYEFNHDENAVEWACLYGHVNVLEWFHNSGYTFKYRWDNVLSFSVVGKNGIGGGHVHVLEWFKTHIFHRNNLPPLNAVIIRNIAWATNSRMELDMIEWLTYNYPYLIETLDAMRVDEAQHIIEDMFDQHVIM